MKPMQPRKPLNDDYNKIEFLREMETLHKRLNELIISPANGAIKADYEAADTGTAAAIAAIFNLQAAAINAILAKLDLT